MARRRRGAGEAITGRSAGRRRSAGEAQDETGAQTRGAAQATKTGRKLRQKIGAQRAIAGYLRAFDLRRGQDLGAQKRAPELGRPCWLVLA